MLPFLYRSAAIVLLASFIFAGKAAALVVYGTSPTDTDNSYNTTPPANGSPWYNVVQFGTNNASGVYLGNGYVLTANHVTVVDSGIVINGVNYNRDTTFTPLLLADGVDYPDLKLVKILGTPGSPVMSKLPINYSTGISGDTGKPCTLIGCGVGKGAVVPSFGWAWGDDSTHAKRWGANSVPGMTNITPFSGYSYTYASLYTTFQPPVADSSSVAQITLGDSGGGLFQFIGETWKLSGLATLVSQAGYAYFLDNSFFVRLQKYAFVLRYENWANLKLGSPTASETADPDKDGLPNLLEYAFHTDPNSAASSSLPTVGIEPGYVTLTYTKLMSATDLGYVVEATDSLSPSNWQPATVTEEILATSGVTATIKAKVAFTTETQKFLRLRVTRLP